MLHIFTLMGKILFILILKPDLFTLCSYMNKYRLQTHCSQALKDPLLKTGHFRETDRIRDVNKKQSHTHIIYIYIMYLFIIFSCVMNLLYRNTPLVKNKLIS